MAAKETVNSYRADVEATVNRWIVEYYCFQALELFKNEEYAKFCEIRDILDNVLLHPFESSDVMPTKLAVLLFLSRINEGENLDLMFDSDKSITPLESALIVLEGMSQACSTPVLQQRFKTVRTSLKEMMVTILIKNDNFERAKEVLNKHFPKPMVGKKAIFMGLIKKESKMHEVIEQMDFQRFKQEMLAFCKSLCSFSVPFLYKAATQLIDKRNMEHTDDREERPDDEEEDDDRAAGPEEQDEAGLSSSPQRNTIQFVPRECTINRTRLEMAYRGLAAGSDESTFAQLEVEEEEQVRKNLPLSSSPRKEADQDLEQDRLFHRDSGSPLEASPADQPPQTDAVPQSQADLFSKMPPLLRKRQRHNVARLVVEPDSQRSSQCTTASQELETEMPPQSPVIPNEKVPQSPDTDSEVTKPVRKLPRRANKINHSSTSLAELTADGEEDPPGSVANGEVSVEKRSNQSNSSLTNNSALLEQSSESNEDPQESVAASKTPEKKNQPASDLLHKQVQMDPDDIHISDSSPNSSLELFPLKSGPQTSSTPNKGSAQDKDPSHSKWKQLYNSAKESKDTWSDEESYFKSRKTTGAHNESTVSNSGHRKRRWTENETEKLKQGVKKFGEGNWSKIRSYYSFKDRTNVNLKDRWRTMKKSNMV